MRTALRLAAVATAAVCALAGCSPGQAGNDEPTDALEVVSWWTSGSEQQALQVLFDAYTEAHAGVEVTNATVAGGGGSNAQVVLAQRLLAGDPPDSWQTFPGGALRAYVSQQEVADVSGVYAQTGLTDALPPVIRDGLTVAGKQYGVPTSAHRGNVLFFNLGVLSGAGVARPAAGYSTDAFLADLRVLDEEGVTPLCLGARDPFTTAALFENILLGVVGTDGWRRIAEDRFDWRGENVREALRQFDAILAYADPEAGALSWDAATQKLADGECGFETLNDSAYGELVSAGAREGTDFSQVPYPGTDQAYVAVVDTFVRPPNAENGRNATDFLAVIAAPETQLAFSRAKGSVPVRTDVDTASLSPYQQSAAEALRSTSVLWSIVHGEATTPQLQQGFYDAVQTFVRSRDAGTFSKTLSDAVNRQPPPK
jgi:glucose/mannose transport system substrate-binding protein